MQHSWHLSPQGFLGKRQQKESCLAGAFSVEGGQLHWSAGRQVKICWLVSFGLTRWQQASGPVRIVWVAMQSVSLPQKLPQDVRPLPQTGPPGSGLPFLSFGWQQGEPFGHFCPQSRQLSEVPSLTHLSLQHFIPKGASVVTAESQQIVPFSHRVCDTSGQMQRGVPTGLAQLWRLLLQQIPPQHLFVQAGAPQLPQ